MAVYVSIRDGMTNADQGDLMHAINALLQDSGIIAQNGSMGLQVTENGSPNMTVNVAAGEVVVKKTAWSPYSTNTKFYHVINTAAITAGLIIAANPGAERIDLVCVEIDEGATPDADASNVGSIVIVQGVSGAGVPATPDNHYKLAEITVANGATSITNANITDRRVTSKVSDFIFGEPTLDNNKAYKIKNLAGTAQDVLKVNTSNQLLLGDLDLASLIQLIPEIGSQVNAIQNFEDDLARQLIINGGFDIWQRNTTFTPNDDQFVADRWNALVSTNASWTFARDTDVPSVGGVRYSLKATKTGTGANAQCAIVQFIEAADAVKFAGKSLSLSFWAKTNGTEIGNLRATILSWNSTADSITSDVISSWAGGGTDPTFATNWTKEIAGSNLALTSSWQRFKIENINIDTASMANLAIVVWVDDTTISTNDDFFITMVNVNEGAAALPWYARSFQFELHQCKRYFQQAGSGFLGKWYSASAAQIGGSFVVPMRTNPSVTLNTSTPSIDEIGVASRTGSGSSLVSNVFTTAFSGAYNIDGFSGAGVNAVALGRTNMLNLDAEL